MTSESFRVELPWLFNQIRANCSNTQQSGKSVRTWKDYKTGEAVPHWRQRIGRLLAASSGYTRSGWTMEPGSIEMSARFDHVTCGDWYERRFQRRLPTGSPAGLTGNTSGTINKALSKFLANATATSQPFQGQVAVAELRETLQMLRSPARSLRDFLIRKLRKSKRKGASVRKTLADNWLEWQYGWSPLLGDIESAVDAYVAFQSDIEVRHVGSYATDQFDGVLSEYNLPYATYFRIKEFRKAYREVTAHCVGAFKVRYSGIQDSQARKIQELTGITWDSVPGAIWEAIPYSFVVDMFTNVGEILNGFHARNLDWIYHDLSYKEASILESSYNWNDGQMAAFDFLKAKTLLTEPAKVSRFLYARAPSTLYLPSLYVSLPPLGFSWANLWALMASRQS